MVSIAGLATDDVTDGVVNPVSFSSVVNVAEREELFGPSDVIDKSRVYPSAVLTDCEETPDVTAASAPTDVVSPAAANELGPVANSAFDVAPPGGK